MNTLSREHRRMLEKTVAEARRIAEEGARKLLADQYAVHHHEPWPHMSPAERELRNQLRAHGRQLGDVPDERRKTQHIDHLVQACAYEHWHRMLFARFLAENDLLLDAEHGVAMTLEEVRELAREQGRDWMDLAAELAQRMLLAVFRPDDPVLKLQLPPETRQQLEEKLASLPREIFLADDSLGWVYQFWQRDEKDRVNRSEVKIGADELPAVTQLFTEDYMVLFLLENTLGAWWTAKRCAEGKDPALPGYEWTYLRLNEDGSPAAGTFDDWPRAARDLKVLDPCMGSGHFLVCALPILARMRMEEEGISLQEALAAVLKENLFGLELDARCSQIAAFNLALAAWRMVGEHCPLPQLNLACSGLGIHAVEADWVKLAGDDGLAREEMRRLYSLFKDAPTLGSLIDPLRLERTVYSAGAERVLPLIEEALQQEQSDEARELAIAAQGVLAAFRILASRFTLVATNVPYLGRGKQDPILAQYCAEFHADAKADLATCFVDRCLRFCREGGSAALVTPQNWLFSHAFCGIRKKVLSSVRWDLLVRLGPNAFQGMNWWAAITALVVLTAAKHSPGHKFVGVDVGDVKEQPVKASLLQCRHLLNVGQLNQLSNPDQAIALEDTSSTTFLRDRARSIEGLSTGDADRFLRKHWELPCIAADWECFHVTPDETREYDGLSEVLYWERGQGALADSSQARIQGQYAWGRPGVLVSKMNRLKCSLYFGAKHDKISAAIIPTESDDLPALWAFCSSPDFYKAVRSVTQLVGVSTESLVAVPFDRSHWLRTAAEKYPAGLPSPFSGDPTQYVFSGGVALSQNPLQVAVARLMSYRWPRQTGSSFPDCPALAPDGLETHADADGIVPLAAIAGEASAADRLRALLADAYGSEWSAAKLRELLGECTAVQDKTRR